MEPSTAEARSAVCGDGRAQSASVDAVGNAKLCQCEQAKALCPGLPVTGGFSVITVLSQACRQLRNSCWKGPGENKGFRVAPLELVPGDAEGTHWKQGLSTTDQEVYLPWFDGFLLG